MREDSGMETNMGGVVLALLGLGRDGCERGLGDYIGVEMAIKRLL